MMDRQLKVLAATPIGMFVVGFAAVIGTALWQQPVTDKAIGSIGWAVLSFILFAVVTLLLLIVRSRTMWSRDKVEDMLLGVKFAGAPWLLMGSLSSLQNDGITLPALVSVICGALVLGWIEVYVKPKLEILDQIDLLGLHNTYVNHY